MSRKSKLITWAILGLSAVALTSCSAPAAPTTAAASYSCDKPKSDTMTDITVVGMPILSNAALFVGDEQGFFKENGLKPTFQMVASPPAGISALAGGSANFAFTTSVNLLQAVQQGQQVKGVAAFAGIEPGYYEKMKARKPGYTTGINALLVHSGSDINSPKDLEGKTVAVQDPVFSQMMVEDVVKAAGGDPAKVRFVPMPAADSYQALLAGKIDAAQSAQPFIDGWEGKGLKNLGWLEVEVFHDGPTSFMVANDDYIAKNPETVARFNCAIAASAAYANAHPDQLRDETAKRQGINRAALDKAVVPYFFTKSDVAGVERFAKLMVQFKHLDKVPNIHDVLADVATRN